MTITTVSIACDIGLPDNAEFSASRLDFTLSGPDYDTASNDAIPAATVSVALDASGIGTALLWPVDRGVRNTKYSVTLVGSRTVDGRVQAQTYSLGTISPPSAGAPHDLADLLAQSSGGIVVGSTIYATLADAVAAAIEAANNAEAWTPEFAAEAVAAAAAVANSALDAAGFASAASGSAASASGSAASASGSAASASASAASASASAASASGSAAAASGSEAAAAGSAAQILGLTAAATTLSPGSSATASYNAGTGVMTFGIPEGQPGTGNGDVSGPASSGNGRIAVFNGTTGKLLQDGGSTVAQLAPKASPAFSGTPTAPTASPGTNTTQIATTAFVQANKASPAFSGTPTAPTAPAGTNTTQIATTAFVQANKASPAFSGTPTAPTAPAGTNTTQIATTEFVATAVEGASGPVKAWVNFNGTGTVAIRAAFNVSSITDNGTGDYTVNFTSAMSDANYATLVSGREDESGGNIGGVNIELSRFAQTSGAVRVGSGNPKIDLNTVTVAVFR